MFMATAVQRAERITHRIILASRSMHVWKQVFFNFMLNVELNVDESYQLE